MRVLHSRTESIAVWLAIAAMLLAACGGGAATPDSEETQPGDGDANGATEGSVEGSIVLYKGPFSPNEEEEIGELIAGFQVEHPDVDVEFEQFDWEGMAQQFPTRFMSDDPPDVNAVPDLEYGKWVERGAFEDLTPYIEDPAWAEEFAAIPDEVWDIARGPDGKIYGVPWWGVVLSMLFVNEDLLEQAGVDDFNSSPEAFADAVREIDALGDDVFGFGIRTDQFNPAAFDWASWLHTAGARLLNDDWSECTANTTGAQDTFDFLSGLIVEEQLAPAPGAYDQQGLQDLFIAGRLGITHDANGFVSTLLDEDPDFDFDVAPLPPGTTGEHATGMWGLGLLTMSSRSEDKDAAWEFIRYLTSADVVVDYFTRTSLLPNRTDVADRMFEGDPYSAKVVDEVLPGARGWQLHPDLNEMLGRAQPAFDRLFRGDADAAEALAEVCGAVEDSL